MLRRLRLPALSAVLFVCACAGPPIPGPVEDVPVCPDFELGRAKMEGSLHYPVRLRILDGKDVVFKTIINGRRRAEGTKVRTFIADDNAEYTVEWAQCANERAPQSAQESVKVREKRESDTAYDCGEAKVYATQKLVTTKGDPASHGIKYAPPPNPACWAGDAKPPEVPDAGAAAPVVDAGVATTDAGAADAGVATTDAGAAASDAGAKVEQQKPAK